jgi:maltose O-acetyltransferase
MLRRFLRIVIIKFRILLYRFLSDKNIVNGSYICKSPIYTLGNGKVIFENVELGVLKSPPFSPPIFFNPRNKDSVIHISTETKINVGVQIISEDCKVSIGTGCFIGEGVLIISSDFHGILKDDFNSIRGSGGQGDIFIEDNVFIGSRAIIFKGVTIGKGATISAGSRVYKNVDSFSIHK